MSPRENNDPNGDLLRGEGDCLAPEQLELLLGVGGDAAVRQRFQIHVSGCAACAAELDLIRGFLRSAVEPGEEKDLAWVVSRVTNPAITPPRAPAKISWWSAWTSFSPLSKVAVTFASLLLIVAGAIRLRELRVGQDAVRDHGGVEVMRSTEVALAAPKGDLSTVPSKLSWSPVDSAARYEAVVEEVDGTVLWKGESATPEIALPGTLQSQVLPKKTLVWHVTAYNSRGERIAESQRERFRLLP